MHLIIRFTLVPGGDGTELTVDQDGVPDEVHEHVRTTLTGFYLDPFIKHFVNQG